MKLLKILDSFFEKVIEFFLYSFLSVLVFLSFLQIILRNFFNTNVIWADTFLRHLVLWIAFFGAAIAVKKGRHIQIDIGRRYLKPKIKKIVTIIIYLFSLFICYQLSIASYEFVFNIIDLKETLFLEIPTRYFILILPIGYIVLAFRFFLSAIIFIEEIFYGNWEIKETII